MTGRAGVAVVLALVAVGCGESPEDEARDAGKDLGAALHGLQTAPTPQDASRSLQSAQAALADLRSEVPGGARTELQAIGDQLAEALRAATDPAAVRAAFLAARSQLDALRSDTDSVVNEVRRGVREGYEDAAEDG